MIAARALFVGLLVSFVLAAGLAQADAWRTYQNPRFGASAQYPAGWTTGPEPENGDGLTFSSPDKSASLTISGIYSVLSRQEEFAIRLRAYDGETIVYKKQAPDWVVVSGTKGDRIFYRKSLLKCDVWNDLSFEYPAADKAKYDSIVGHSAASLKGAPGACK